MQTMGDLRWGMIDDCRSPICEAPLVLAVAHVLFQGRSPGLTPKDVKNEDRPGYLDENKGEDDKMSSEKHAIYQENAPNEA
jgi:hypothetical protein